MSKRALAGGYGPAQKDGRTQPGKQASQTPLEFALAFMRDSSKPDALRAGMAKAVLPYLHTRGEAPEDSDAPAKEPMSDLEAARRIAHILERGRREEEKQAESRSVSLSPTQVGPARLAHLRTDVGQARHPAGRGCPPEPEGRRRAGEGVQVSTAANCTPSPTSLRSAPSPRKRGEGTQATAPTQRTAWPDDDAAQSPDIHPDPHPGYRWIR